MWRVLYGNARGSIPQVWLRGTFANGQIFSFACIDEFPEEIWTGVLRGQQIKLKQRAHKSPDEDLGPVYFWASDDQAEQMKSQINAFLRADVDTTKLYANWSSSCRRFAEISDGFQGIRLLDQEPWECLVSFIASSNNHISRITKMLHALRTHYGEPLTDGSGLYAFPSPEAISQKASVDDLRQLGYGYRAKYVIDAAKIIHEKSSKGETWLENLRRQTELSNEDLRKELTSIPGVGPKVADCVALFSLNRLQIVPVDVHVFQIAKRHYDDEKRLVKFTSISKPVYKIVSDLFLARFGPLAGWAHSVLFTSELPAFRSRLSNEIQAAMLKFKQDASELKKELKRAKEASGLKSKKRLQETTTRQ